MSEPDYRVNLEIYNGPLDLLLYLIRREEVDIHDIPIARITEQYVHYVEMLQRLDPNLAGDFLVMAASLMEIKARMLLPTEQFGEGDEDGLDIDPRADLVRQLLQYKAFRDAADDLAAAAELQALRHPRRPGEIDFDDEKEHDIDEVEVWDLFDAFKRVMDAIGKLPTEHEVIYDDTPIELHADDLLDRLRREGAMTFRQVFEGRESRSEVVGLFLALLELIRQRKVLATQGEIFGQIDIELNPEPPEEADFQMDEPTDASPPSAEQADPPAKDQEQK